MTDKELDILFDWLDPEKYVPPKDITETAMIVSFGLLLVGLLYAARSPILYGTVFVVYTVWLIVATRHLNRELRRAIQASRDRLKRDVENLGLSESEKVHRQGVDVLYQQGLDTIEGYFLARPHLMRQTSILVCSCFGLALAIHAKLSDSQASRSGAYIVFVVILVLSEAVITSWRHARDKALRPLEAELVEIERTYLESRSADRTT